MGFSTYPQPSPDLIEMQKYLKIIRKLIAVVEDHAIYALLYKLI